MEAIKVYTYDDDPIKSVLVKLSREDVELLNEAYEGIRCALVIESHNVRPLVKFVFDLLTEVEK